jgi:hypothetical protein
MITIQKEQLTRANKNEVIQLLSKDHLFVSKLDGGDIEKLSFKGWDEHGNAKEVTVDFTEMSQSLQKAKHTKKTESTCKLFAENCKMLAAHLLVIAEKTEKLMTADSQELQSNSTSDCCSSHGSSSYHEDDTDQKTEASTELENGDTDQKTEASTELEKGDTDQKTQASPPKSRQRTMRSMLDVW